MAWLLNGEAIDPEQWGGIENVKALGGVEGEATNFGTPEEFAKEYYSSPRQVEWLTSQIPAYEQGIASGDPAYSGYTQLYGAFPTGGSDADKLAWMQRAASGGLQEHVRQDAASPGWIGDQIMNSELAPVLLFAALYAGVGGFSSLGSGGTATAGAAEAGAAGTATTSGAELAGLVESGTTGTAGAALENAALAGEGVTYSTGTGALLSTTGGANLTGTTSGIENLPTSTPTPSLVDKTVKWAGEQVGKSLIGQALAPEAPSAPATPAASAAPFSFFSGLPWKAKAATGAPGLARLSTGTSVFGAGGLSSPGIVGSRLGRG